MEQTITNNITKLLETTGNLTYNNSIETINLTIQQINNLQNTIQQNNTFTYFLYGIMLLLIAFPIIYNKWREKKAKLQERREQTQKELKELVEKLAQYEEEIEDYQPIDGDPKKKKIIRLSEIYIDNLPKEIQFDLLEKTNALKKLFNDEKEQKQPWLILLKEGNEIEIRKKAKAGMLKLKSKDSNNKEITKAIMISASKLHNVKIGKKTVGKTYVAYENEAEAYPIKPKHFAELFFMEIQKILLTEKGLDGKGFKFPKWIIWIIIIAIIGGIGYMIWQGQTPEATQITQTTQTIIQNVTQNTTNLAKEGTTVVTIG